MSKPCKFSGVWLRPPAIFQSVNYIDFHTALNFGSSTFRRESAWPLYVLHAPAAY